MKFTIVHIDDCLDSLQYYSSQLMEDFIVVNFTDSKAAVEYLTQVRVDAVILDYEVPSLCAKEVCQRLKSSSVQHETPILVLTDGRCSEVVCDLYDMGIDDLIEKPVQKRELVARIKNRLLKAGHCCQIVGLIFDTFSQIAYYRNQEITLTSIEFKLLFYLAHNSGVYVSREELSEKVWKLIEIDRMVLNTHLSNLRLKLKGFPFEITSSKNKGILFRELTGQSN